MHGTQMKMDMMARDMRWPCVLGTWHGLFSGTWHDVSTRPSHVHAHVRSEKAKKKKKGRCVHMGKWQMSTRGAEQDAKDRRAVAGGRGHDVGRMAGWEAA